MDLSLIIPCRNLENYVGKLIETLNKQQFTMNLEVMFICDSCTDKTFNVIFKNLDKDKYKNFKLVDGNFGSVGYARNYGLDNTTGKYIWFIDGDDWLTYDNAIEDIYQEMINNNLDIGEFRIKSVANPEGVYGLATVWRVMYSRDIIGNTRFEPLPINEDSVFNDIVFNKGGKYGKIDIAPYFYNHPRKGSIMDLTYHYFKDDENNN